MLSSNQPQPFFKKINNIFILAWKSALVCLPIILIINIATKLPLIFFTELAKKHVVGITPFLIYSILIVTIGTFAAVMIIRAINNLTQSNNYNFDEASLFALKKFPSIIGLLIIFHVSLFFLFFLGITIRNFILTATYLTPDIPWFLVSNLSIMFLLLFILLMSFIFTIPAIAIDGKNALNCIIMSIKLVYKNFWNTFLIFLISLLPFMIIMSLMFYIFGQFLILSKITNTIPYLIFEFVLSSAILVFYCIQVVQYNDAKLHKSKK